MVRGAWSALRFFAVIGLHPLYAIVIVVLVTILGMTTVWFDRKEVDSGLGMILFAQMYLASSGFLVRARQGHFDPILTSAASRTAVVFAHWLVSILPGLVAWLATVAVAALAGNGAASTAVVGPRAVGFLIVSALAWAAGFALPRGAAGMLWMAALVALVGQRTEFFASGSTTALILCPFLVLGNRPPFSLDALVVSLLVSLAALLVVLRLADGLDLYLVNRA